MCLLVMLKCFEYYLGQVKSFQFRRKIGLILYGYKLILKCSCILKVQCIVLAFCGVVTDCNKLIIPPLTPLFAAKNLKGPP